MRHFQYKRFNLKSCLGRGSRFVLLSSTALVIILALLQDLAIFPIAAVNALGLSGAPTVPQQVEVITLATPDGHKIESWFLPPEKDGRFASHGLTAVVFHGNGGTLEGFFDFQRWFAWLGIASYSLDYRGYGRSSGWPNETNVLNDAKQLWEEIQKRQAIVSNGTTSDRTIIFGQSIGTGPASWLATQVKPKCLMLLSPYTSISGALKTHQLLGYAHTVLSPFLRNHFANDARISELTSTRLIIAHGERDRLIPIQHSHRLEAIYRDAHISEKSNIEVVYDKDAEHNDLFGRTHGRIEQALARLLN